VIVIDAEKMGNEAMAIGLDVAKVIDGRDVIATAVALCNVLEVLAETSPAHRYGITNQLLRSIQRVGGERVTVTSNNGAR